MFANFENEPLKTVGGDEYTLSIPYHVEAAQNV